MRSVDYRPQTRDSERRLRYLHTPMYQAPHLRGDDYYAIGPVHTGPKVPILIEGMYGIGDNLHQRAAIRALMPSHDIWLKTCHIALYHDLVEQGLKLLWLPTHWRAQARTIAYERTRYAFSTVPVPSNVLRIKCWYHQPEIDKYGSIAETICGVLGVQPKPLDFSLPIPIAWRERARKLIASCDTEGKPILIYRPIVMRGEWDASLRNPDSQAYEAIYQEIRKEYCTISIADLEPSLEWIVGREQEADVKFHKGELDFEIMAALFAEANMVMSPAGFAPVLAQAVGTPIIAVYGGRESYRTTERGGAHLAPTLGIDPDKPCDCHLHIHDCAQRKHITLPPALERVRAFTKQYTTKPRVLLYGTTYIDSPDRVKLTEHWITLHTALNPDCDILLIDSNSPMLSKVGNLSKVKLHQFGDNVGHLSRAGRDGWGRAFCKGLELAVEQDYDYAVHIEGDSLFRLPVLPIVRSFMRDKVKCASTPVRGMTNNHHGWVETGLMFFSTDYLKQSRFTLQYDWPIRKESPTPEVVVHNIVAKDLTMMPWRALRGDKNQITHENVESLSLDWITHCHTDMWAYDNYMKSLGKGERAARAGDVRKVNFGCGDNRLEGWANHDAEVDISKTLPYADASVDFILCEHCVEHIDYYEAINFFKECWRILKPQGVVRIVVPSLEQIMREATPDYCSFVHSHGWAPSKDKRGAMHAILYQHGHRTAWSASKLESTLYYCGFDPRLCEVGKSERPELQGIEGHGKVIGDSFNRIESIVCEGSKP